MGEALMTSWSDRNWTSRDGLKLHYRDYAGPADRPPVLCLHGLTRNARDFEALAERLAGDWRVIVPDFRGRGMSEQDPNSRNYVPPVYAQDVIALLDELSVERAVFIGTSLGGLVTMIIAALAPDRIAGAVLNDIGPELDMRGIERIRTYVGKPMVFGSFAEAGAAIGAANADIHPRYGSEEWERFARRACRETERGVEFDYDMRIADAFKQSDAEPVPDAWPLFLALKGKPLLILRGGHSELFPQEVAKRMIDAVPGAELVTVPNVGHAPDLDEPEAVEAIQRLLERVAG